MPSRSPSGALRQTLLPSRLFALPLLVMMSAAPVGCGVLDIFEDKTTLADLDPKTASVEVELDAQPLVNLALEGNGGCESITDDVEAKVDGVQMDLFQRGGQQPSKGGWVCNAPTFRRSLSADDLGGASTHFEVADDSKRIALDVEGLLVERSLVPDSMNNKITAGEELGLGWSASKDQIDDTTLEVEFVYDDATLVLAAPPEARVSEGKLFVKLPADAPKGAGKLDVDVKVHVPASVCEGAPTCEAVVHVTTEVALDVIEGPAGPP